MQQELSRQARMVEKAEKYQRERDRIMEDNENLHNEVEQIRAEYKQKESDIEWKYKSKIKGLEKENNNCINYYINKIISNSRIGAFSIIFIQNYFFKICS